MTLCVRSGWLAAAGCFSVLVPLESAWGTMSFLSASREVNIHLYAEDQDGVQTPHFGPFQTVFTGIGPFSESIVGSVQSNDGTAGAHGESSQISDISQTEITFSAVTAGGGGGGLFSFVGGESSISVNFAIDSPVAYSFDWSARDFCDQDGGCTYFVLEALSSTGFPYMYLFEKQGGTVNYSDRPQTYDDPYAGLILGTLSAGEYRLTAYSWVYYGAGIDTTFRGAPLDFTFTVPEPSTAFLVLTGLLGIAVRQRRQSEPCTPVSEVG